MPVLNHGVFSVYSPEPDEEKPRTLIPGIWHSKNQNDVDFYDVKASIPETSLVVLVPSGDTRICGASRGQLMAFPTEGQTLFEITDAPLDLAPESTLGRVFDPLTGEISPLVPVAPAQITAKADIFRRASEEQSIAMVAMLASQDVRIQEIFKAAQHIDHSDEMFTLLINGLTQLFGEVEANRLLAVS